MTTIETRGRNVLAELDQRVPTSFYWSLTVLATIGGFLFGYDTAVGGPLIGSGNFVFLWKGGFALSGHAYDVAVMAFFLYMVAFMALECLRIVDGPGLLVLVCNKADFVAV